MIRPEIKRYVDRVRREAAALSDELEALRGRVAPEHGLARLKGITAEQVQQYFATCLGPITHDPQMTLVVAWIARDPGDRQDIFKCFRLLEQAHPVELLRLRVRLFELTPVLLTSG